MILQYPDFQIVCTGHSLGAALSSFAAADLATFPLLELGLSKHFQLLGGFWPFKSRNILHYSFGLPRTGNSGWAKWFNQVVDTSYHMVNSRDIVPHLPPQDFGFHHFSQEVWYPSISNFSKFIICDGSGEDPHCSDSLDFYESSDHHCYLGYYVGCSMDPVPQGTKMC